MFILARALTYATLFIGLVLVFVPSRLLALSGSSQVRLTGLPLALGVVFAMAGAALALWSVVAFASKGRGTPAPFDPPRRLVVTGPYRYVRNPMYVGAGLVVAGAAVCFASLLLAAYLCLLLLASHLFIVHFEEPRLKRVFGQEYADYCRTTRRWIPGR